MRRATIAAALIVALTATLCAYVDTFTVSSVYEQQLISHQRLRFTVSTSALFPYTGQVGWRLLFSRFEIGSSDPQYEYACWSFPAQSADLSQEIWIVRPQGLVGEWHYRIDAVDSARAPLATSGEIVHYFGAEVDQVLTDTIPYTATSVYWATSIAVTNVTDEATTARLDLYDTAGNPWGDPIEVVIPARGIFAAYLSRLVGLREFCGSIRISSSSRCKWLTISSDGQGTTHSYSGVLQ